MKIQYLALIPVALCLLSCSESKRTVNLNLRYVTASSAPLNAGDVNAQAQIAQAASSVDASLQKLSAMEMASQPKLKLPDTNPNQMGMEQLASIDWNGPVQPVVEKIAAASHYRLRILGQAPAIPALVVVNAQDQPLGDLLRNITYQVATKARIKVYSSYRVIELRYLDN